MIRKEANTFRDLIIAF